VWKRWLVGIVIVLICSLAVSWLFPASLYVSLGTLRREAFFDGKPTSYWVRALKQERFLGHPPPGGDVGKTLREGGAAAVPVLRAMTADPDESVRSEALRVLTFLGPDAKPAQTGRATSGERVELVVPDASAALHDRRPSGIGFNRFEQHPGQHADPSDTASPAARTREPSRTRWTALRMSG